MNKRDFMRSLALGLLGLGASPLVLAGQRSDETSMRRKNWVWLTLERDPSADVWQREFARWRTAGIEAVIAEVYNGRQAFWASRMLPVAYPRLEKLLPIAKAAGLELHAWMWCMPCLVDDVQRRHPDWYNVNARGESALEKPAYVDYYRFLDPANPEVREFLQSIVRELAGIEGLRGVHLDYIRHPDAILPKGLWAKYGLVQDRVLPQFDYGYTRVSRDAFRQRFGLDPMQMSDPEANREWLRYRLDSVTELVNAYLVPAAHAGGKQITAAVFPGPTLARQMVRQDWGRWHLDAFMPMLYHDFYQAGAEWVRAQTEEGVATVKQPLYSGLFVPQVVAPGLTRLVEAALAGGAAGVSLFHAHAMDESMWNALAQAMRPR
jgi:uncharacterized lipoprotein YddW (UPF0748 family)